MAVFLPSLKKSGHLDRIQMTICNIGSRKIDKNDDYASLGWGIFAPNLKIYGFDADEGKFRLSAPPPFSKVNKQTKKGDFVMTEPNYLESVLTPDELKAGRDRIAAANINNVLHHCRKCDYEWVASHAEACRCGSKNVERIMCWQFPDD